jgi:flagellar protein FliO/FliZ
MKKFALTFFAACALAVTAFAAPTDENQVIVPNSGAAKTAAPAVGAATGSAFTIVAVLFLAGAGGWLLWRGRGGKLATLSRASRQLTIEETRSLGNRQYLVVASYQDKKFLLGICPGRIDLLSPLHDGATPMSAPAKDRP